MDVLYFVSNKDDKSLPFVNNSVGRLRTHCLQRVGGVIPSVVVWSLCIYSHGWVGKCSEILAA